MRSSLGSAIVREIVEGLTASGAPKKSLVKDVLAFVKKLANGVKRARK